MGDGFVQKRLERDVGEAKTRGDPLRIALGGDASEFVAGTARRGRGQQSREIWKTEALIADRADISRHRHSCLARNSCFGLILVSAWQGRTALQQKGKKSATHLASARLNRQAGRHYFNVVSSPSRKGPICPGARRPPSPAKAPRRAPASPIPGCGATSCAPA
jgi:hypothetical protein